MSDLLEQATRALREAGAPAPTSLGRARARVRVRGSPGLNWNPVHLAG